MKKFLVIAVLVALCGVVFAQNQTDPQTSHTYTVSQLTTSNAIEYSVTATPQNDANKLKIDVAENVNGITYFVYDVSGKIVIKDWFRDTTGYINMANLADGAYNVVLYDNYGKEKRFKVVKQ